MERLLQQGPINSSSCGVLLGEGFDSECYGYGLVEDETQSLDDAMPFLEMLQSVETQPFFPFKEPNFQTLLKLQHLKKPCEGWEFNNSCSYTTTAMTDQTEPVAVDQLESCVTHENNVPVKSETKEPEPNSANWTKETQLLSKSCPVKERKKRKRTRVTKNKEEVESQRMTHIAVERNRRRQMNDHLNSLRSLMPPSYVLRGDQASIIGGAIDFVKELEQLLHSLEEQKRMRREATAVGCISEEILKEDDEEIFHEEEGAKVRKGVEVSQVSSIQNHVNLKIHCDRRPGQLLRAIVAMEELKLTVLHLNITSSQTTVFYSFNLKIEEGSEMRSGDEVVAAVYQIFSRINGC